MISEQKNKTVIWKYVVSPNGYTEHPIPINARFLSVGLVMGEVCVWAEVDPTAEKITRCFRVVDTGAHLDAGENRTFFGTVVNLGYVSHVFCVEREEA